MRYPEFYDEAPRITLYDPLAKFLGAAEGGIIEYRYVDAVKLAGHSCPTVASAWLMTARALEALYPKDVPERGAIRVDFRQDSTSGVTGVIANIVTLVTGATQDTGFKGLAGRFDRRKLLFFNATVVEEIRFTRQDTGAAVGVTAHLDHVPSAPHVGELMAACLTGRADGAAQREFGRLWQERVRAILLDHARDAQVIVVRPVGAA
ncbi:MAG: hypothetical protein HS110_02310 [Zoogloeaceae bacterium]|nr:hypothetical protein [Zoogloeaceae bacterium]MCK6385840.1 FmdE family protein [Rhodocyclaceae bacterium]